MEYIFDLIPPLILCLAIFFNRNVYVKKGIILVEQTLEILCEKLGVTADTLIGEMYRHSVMLDYIGLVFWTVAVIVTTILTIKFKSKWVALVEENDWYMLLIIIPIVVGIFAVILIPDMIVDLIGWYISPMAQAIKNITQ